MKTFDPTRILLVGGIPFDEPLLMWWNYVARDREEILKAHADWMAESDRFGGAAVRMRDGLGTTLGEPCAESLLVSSPWSPLRGAASTILSTHP